jgi:hypothetical protein
VIWFACKKCGKTLGRSDTSAGALVFCDCGNGARVPWESTVAPPEVETLPQAPATAPQRPLEPIRFDEKSDPGLAGAGLSGAGPPGGGKRRGRRAAMTPIDPNVCFNHASHDKEGVCLDCGLSFCKRCLTTFQNVAYCAACKNYRTRIMQRRPDSSKLALVSFLIALAAGPLMFLLMPLAASKHAQAFVLLALIPPLLALAAGILSLRWIRGAAQRTGQHLAVSGMSLGAVVGILTLLIVVFGQKIWV